jgi:hypothetical protein
MSNIAFKLRLLTLPTRPFAPRSLVWSPCSFACLLKVYPGWQMWIYHDATAPDRVLTAMRALPHVRTVDMSSSGIANQMSWKFLIASDATVER